MSGHSRASKKRSKVLAKKTHNHGLMSALGMGGEGRQKDRAKPCSSSSSSSSSSINNSSRNSSKRQQQDPLQHSKPAKAPRPNDEVTQAEGQSEVLLLTTLPEGASLNDIIELEDVVQIDARTRAHVMLNLMTAACDSKSLSADNGAFYKEYWETKPLVVERHARGHFKGLLPRKKVDRVIDGHCNMYGADLVLSGAPSATDEEGITEARPQNVWRALRNGRTVRLLQPQKHIDSLWHLCSALEHEFGCRVGCEVDLTPPPASFGSGSSSSSGSELDKEAAGGFGTQTTAEDCFFLCTAGRERWALYAPPPGAELPMYCMELAAGPEVASELTIAAKEAPAAPTHVVKVVKPTMECILHAGDTLYLPRGWKYSCRASMGDKGDKRDKGDKDEISCAVHVRIYTNGSNSMADYLNLIVPTALNAAADETLSLRRGFPRNYLGFLGVAHSENDEEAARRGFLGSLKKALQVVLERSLDMCDAGAELLHKRFISERLPVNLSAREETLSAPSNTIYPFTRLRMVRPGVACCIIEDGQCVVYHCMDNSRELFANPLRPLEFELDDGPTIEALLQAYPESVIVSALPHVSEEIEDKVEVALALYKEGFLLIDDDASKPDIHNGEDDDADPF